LKNQHNIKKITLAILLLVSLQVTYAQNINLEQLVTGKPFKVSGTVSTNSVYFNSNQNVGREPFTYLVQGALNFGLYQFLMPVSYSYSTHLSENTKTKIKARLDRSLNIQNNLKHMADGVTYGNLHTLPTQFNFIPNP